MERLYEIEKWPETKDPTKLISGDQ